MNTGLVNLVKNLCVPCGKKYVRNNFSNITQIVLTQRLFKCCVFFKKAEANKFASQSLKTFFEY